MKRLVTLAGVLGLSSLLGAGYLGRHHLLERWYLAKLESDDLAGRLTAIARLGEIQSSSAVPVLAERLDRPEERMAVLEALQAMGPVAAAAAPALVRFRDDTGATREPGDRRLLRVLESMGEAGLEALLDGMPRSDAEIGWRVSMFAEAPDRSVPFLLEQRASRSPRRTALCGRILRELGRKRFPLIHEFAPGLRPDWSGLWRSNDPLVQQWTADVVWDIAAEKLSYAEFLPGTAGPLLDPDVRGRDLSQAAASLVADLMHLGLRKEALARFWVAKDCSRLRGNCLRVVARNPIIALDHIPQLCAWLSGEVSLRSAAFDALWAIGPATVPMAGSPAEGGGPVISGLVHALHSENTSGKRWAQILLVEIGLNSPEACTAIEEALPRAGPLARPWIEKVIRHVRGASGE